MTFREAEGYEKLAIRLEEHIKQYIPDGWRENIRTVASIPCVSKKDAENFDLNRNSLAEYFEDNKYGPWYVREAITDFFNNFNKNEIFK